MAQIQISSKNEGTAYPFWVIIDPMKYSGKDVNTIAGMFTGIWFSREAAEKHLSGRSYEFGKHAKVYCCSGSQSLDWIEFSNIFTAERPIVNNL